MELELALDHQHAGRRVERPAVLEHEPGGIVIDGRRVVGAPDDRRHRRAADADVWDPEPTGRGRRNRSGEDEGEDRGGAHVLLNTTCTDPFYSVKESPCSISRS